MSGKTRAARDRNDPAPAATGFEALLDTVRERQRAGTRAIGRLFGPARLAAAAAWSSVSGRPLVLFTARDSRLLTLAADLEALTGALGDPRPVFRLPGLGVNPASGIAPHAEVAALRARALAALADPDAAGGSPVVVASAAGALGRTARPDRIRAGCVRLRRGAEESPKRIADQLVAAGYRHEDPVTSRGDFARRGGTLDLYPVDRELPLRVEFAFEEIEDIREFEVETQRSGDHLAHPEAVLAPPAWEWIGAALDSGAHPAFRLPGSPGFESSLADYLGSAAVFVEEPERFREAAAGEAARIRDARPEEARATLPDDLLVPLEEILPEDAVGLFELETPGRRNEPLAARPAPSFENRLPAFLELVKAPGDPRRKVHIFVPGAGAARRFEARVRAAAGSGGPGAPRVFVHRGRLSAGFEMPALGLFVISGAAMVAAPPRKPGRAPGARSFLSDFRDLKPGDPVVHADHGVGRFVRMTRIGDEEDAPELVEIGYARGARLFLPVDRLDLLEKYTAGSAGGAPPLDRLGGTSWATRRRRVRRAMRDIAGDLIRLYATRRQIEGHAFPSETPGMDEFEDGFEWTETEDQTRAIREIFADMERSAPMDRLLAGDVGFGKTEVALRACFKAAMDGKQVAVLVPTTVLAAQHARLFERRFEPFPLRVEMLSRLRTPKQQREVVAGIGNGAVDIVIGTSRLLSKDVRFHDLGLLIVDEEQRFGVAFKERLKRMETRVDHLAMTATPIPRTLHMSLSGIRDMSVIETAPRDRMAIQTEVVPFDTGRITEAIRRELARDGQVYFVHNRVRSMEGMAALLRRLVPEARVLITHGQMRESALEKTLIRFQDGEADILLSTTIIENGLDLPRVNTILVNRADAFGLAQLYQIRGRVGRSSRRAWAYLLVPTGAPLSPAAEPRLAALREFSELGAGFRVAALDMELRGAGDLLGRAQHGHLEAVGFDLYCRLLEEAVAEARGEAPGRRCALKLRFSVRIPESYLPDVRTRMWLYKRCSAAGDLAALARLAAEVRDRFGPPPPEVEMLLEHSRLRVRAEALGYIAITREGGALSFETEPGAGKTGVRFPLAPGAGPAEALDSLGAGLAALEAARSRRQGRGGRASAA